MQLDRIEGRPDERIAWGSDVVAQMLCRLGIPYISLNPGASYRGLRDSIVNHFGNERPGILPKRDRAPAAQAPSRSKAL